MSNWLFNRFNKKYSETSGMKEKCCFFGECLRCKNKEYEEKEKKLEIADFVKKIAREFDEDNVLFKYYGICTDFDGGDIDLHLHGEKYSVFTVQTNKPVVKIRCVENSGVLFCLFINFIECPLNQKEFYFLKDAIHRYEARERAKKSNIEKLKELKKIKKLNVLKKKIEEWE